MATTLDELLKTKVDGDITKVVEQLMETISDFVLAVVTGDFSNNRKLATDIIERTKNVVLVAQQTAYASTDQARQKEVGETIMLLTAAINLFVQTFTDAAQKGSPETHTKFALAAREVGEVVNKLIAVTDQTIQSRVLGAVRKAAVSSKQVQEAAYRGVEILTEAAGPCINDSVELVRVCQQAANATADERKKVALREESDKVKVLTGELIQAARAVTGDQTSQAVTNTLNAKIASMSRCFENLIAAANLSAAYFGKLGETYEQIRKLADAAKELEESAAHFYNVAVNKNTPQAIFEEAMKATQQKAALLAQKTQGVLDKETDLVKKQFISTALIEMQEANAALLAAAKAYRENPTDENKRKLDEAHRRLEEAIKNLVTISSADALHDGTAKGKLAVTATALESSLNDLLKATKGNASPKEVDEKAQLLVGLGLQFVRDAELAAAECDDPAQKKFILDNAAKVKELTEKVAAAARAYKANPTAQNLAALEAASKALSEAISNTKKGARLIPGYVSVKPVEDVEIKLIPGSEMAQLVDAARNEATAANDLAEQATKMLNLITDPKKRKEMEDAIQQVKLLSKKVQEAAEALARNPHDKAAQERLAQAQKELAAGVGRVMQLQNETAKDKDIEEALKTLNQQGAAGEAVMGDAQKLLDSIATMFANMGKLSPKEAIQNAKELSQKANDLSKSLMEMASKVTDPVFKEKLQNGAKVVKDGGLQIKILGAVQSAGGSAKADPIVNCAKSLQSNIHSVLNDVSSEQIRTRHKNSVQRTQAMNKAVNIWKNKQK